MSLLVSCPFKCEYFPVKTTARDGAQMELLTRQCLKSIPSLAMRSRCGVGAIFANGPPYAEMAFSA